MPTKGTSIGVTGALVVAAYCTVAAADRGTLAEAKAMLQQAVTHYMMAGREQALADFSRKKPPFGDRDLYVVCVGPKGIVTAHGGYPTYVGASADILKDVSGKPVGTTIWKTGRSQGSGSLEYPMLNPVSNKVEKKTSFFQNVGDDVCIVGAYSAP